MSLTISDAVHSPGSTLMPSRQNSTSYLRSFESQGNIWVSHRNINKQDIYSVFISKLNIYIYSISS